MGGLRATHYGKEAWTGGKPKHDWSKLDIPSVKKYIPLPTQMRSSSSKAATGCAKRTEGIFSSEEEKHKEGDDLDDFFERMLYHYEIHGIDTVTYRELPNSNPPKMVSVSRYQNHSTWSAYYMAKPGGSCSEGFHVLRPNPIGLHGTV